MFLNFISCSIFAFAGITSALAWQNVSRSQFDSLINGNDIALVAFVAVRNPQSSKPKFVAVMPGIANHASGASAVDVKSSKNLEPEWNLAAAEIENPLITVDCTIEADLCSEYQVVSFPSIRLFKIGKRVERYKGPRKASDIVSYVRRSTLPPVSILYSKNMTSFKSIDDFVFIGYVNQADTGMKSIFNTIASRTHHRFTFGVASDKRLADIEHVLIPSFVCYKTSEGEKEVYSGEWEIGAMESFIEAATTPLIGEMTRRNEMKYLQAGKSLLYIFVPSPTIRSHYSSLLKPLAKKYKEYINFVTIDAVEYSSMAPSLGLESDKFPALALQNPMFGQVFPYQQGNKINIEGVEDWILGIVGGKIKPWEVGGGKENLGHEEL